MSPKSGNRAKRLSLSKKTLKDLEAGPEDSPKVRGGIRNTAPPGCPPPPTVRCIAKTTVPSGCPGTGGATVRG